MPNEFARDSKKIITSFTKHDSVILASGNYWIWCNGEHVVQELDTQGPDTCWSKVQRRGNVSPKQRNSFGSEYKDFEIKEWIELITNVFHLYLYIIIHCSASSYEPNP